MSKPEDTSSALPDTATLMEAAGALDGELRRFEELAAASRKQPLTSQKNIERAARTVREAAASHDRFRLHLGALVEAVAHARDRQQTSADVLSAVAGEIAERTAQLEGLMRRFGEVGAEAASINVLVQEMGSVRREGPNATPTAEILPRLQEIQSRMTNVVQAAQTISYDAAAVDLSDVARQADGLRQQIQSARNKVLLLERRIAEDVSKA